MTPLHYAVRYGHVEVVKLLVECGAGKPDFNGFFFIFFHCLNNYDYNLKYSYRTANENSLRNICLGITIYTLHVNNKLTVRYLQKKIKGH